MKSMARVQDPDRDGNEQYLLLKPVEQAPAHPSSSHDWILVLAVALVIVTDVSITLASFRPTNTSL